MFCQCVHVYPFNTNAALLSANFFVKSKEVVSELKDVCTKYLIIVIINTKTIKLPTI